MKKIYISLFLLSIGQVIVAQTTETFETETNSSTSFTDNSQTFNITTQAGGSFAITNGVGKGWNGTAADNKFIDNSGKADIGIPVQFTIKSSGSKAFKLKSMYLFLSQSDLNPGSGSCTITGKLSNATVFTATSSTGFNSNTGVANGFTLIDLMTYGGTDNSNKSIDEFVITTTDSFEYVALDAMKWDTASTLSIDSFEKNALSIYPNPVSDILNIDYSEEINSIKIINTLGQTVLVKSILAKNPQIDISSLNSGIYFAEIKSFGQTKISKFVKK